MGDMWHLRGFGKCNDRTNCINTLLAISRENAKPNRILESSDAEKVLDMLVEKHIWKKEHDMAN